MVYEDDSPLSVTSSIAGILTFVVAVTAALYARWTYLRNADSEYFQVKSSLSWFKTESMFMQDLIRSSDRAKFTAEGRMEYEMYISVMDQLRMLEERLLEVVAEAEEKLPSGEEEKKWTVVPRGMGFGGGITMSWLPVRAKALELVKRRDALGSRVLFAQMSMISSSVREQEARSRKREELYRERLDKLETMVYSQHEKLDRLEDLVFRLMHQDRIEGLELDAASPRYEEEYRTAERNDETASTSWQSELNDQDAPASPRKPEFSARRFAIPEL